MLTVPAATSKRFVTIDPDAPDCPITFASDGFLRIYGPTVPLKLRDKIAAFTGPDTDAKDVTRIQAGTLQRPPNPPT
jgi:hypothetical protein